MLRKFAILLLFISLGSVPARAFAGEPIIQLSATINEFVTIMSSTPVSELRTTGLPKNALTLIHNRFDFTEMTKRSLGPHWKTLAPAEQGEFVDGLTHRLLMTYGRTVRASGNEKVVVYYFAYGSNLNWPQMQRRCPSSSFVTNFRAQFEREIARTSVQGLLEKIKQRDS